MPVRRIACALLLAALSGCEIPADLVERAEPPSAEGMPYPNLASVPNNPGRARPAAAQAEVRSLEAEREAAREADEKLRAAAIPDAPPLPARIAPLAQARGPAGPPPVPVTPPPRPPSAPALPAGAVSLAFAAGATRLDDGQKETIRASAAKFDAPNSRIRVVSAWSDGGERGQARARAQAVAAEIIRQGVAANRVDIRDSQGTAGRVEIFVDY